jgi:hypothetical protein
LKVLVGNDARTGTKKPERGIEEVLAVQALEGLEFEVLFLDKKTVFIAESEE